MHFLLSVGWKGTAPSHRKQESGQLKERATVNFMEKIKRETDDRLDALMFEIRRMNWRLEQRQLGAQIIDVDYAPTEECLHVTNYPESVMVAQSGSYDNPQEEFEILPVCTACGEVI